jgi:DNA polymerase-3 subunit delta
MKANAAQIARAASNLPPDIRLFLLHGPDEAGAAEIAAKVGRAAGEGAERVDMEGAQLRSNPGRLADEAASLSLFGERRWIRVTGAGEESGEAVSLLLAAERAGNPVVMIAPSLKGTSKLVKLALAAPGAMVHGCYVPEGAEVGRLIAEIAQGHGLRLGVGVAQQLADACGGDRAVLTREIEKLALFLDADPSRPAELDLAALEAVGAALGEAEIAGTVAAAVAGDVAALVRELGLDRGGTLSVPLMRQLAKRLATLAEMRGEVDAGDGIEAVVERHRVFFREKPATMAALRRWTVPRLLTAMHRVRAAERKLMASGSAGEVLAASEATTVARLAARGG